MTGERIVTLALLDEAVGAGCRLGVACRELGLSIRTVERWRRVPNGGEDQRRGPKAKPSHALTEAERAEVVRVANEPEYRSCGPKQIVPRLADLGIYIASESSFYRILRQDNLIVPRGACRPRTVIRPEEIIAKGPNELWSWDITYLPAAVKGTFYYLYLFVDVWSRRIMKAEVRATECADAASELIRAAYAEHGVEPDTLRLHSDNGSPMKGIRCMEPVLSGQGRCEQGRAHGESSRVGETCGAVA